MMEGYDKIGYAPRNGSRLTKEMAENIGTLLERLGTVDTKTVVDACRDESEACHGYFEWNDTRGGQLYRQYQAGNYIRSVEALWLSKTDPSHVLRLPPRGAFKASLVYGAGSESKLPPMPPTTAWNPGNSASPVIQEDDIDDDNEKAEPLKLYPPTEVMLYTPHLLQERLRQCMQGLISYRKRHEHILRAAKELAPQLDIVFEAIATMEQGQQLDTDAPEEEPEPDEEEDEEIGG